MSLFVPRLVGAAGAALVARLAGAQGAPVRAGETSPTSRAKSRCRSKSKALGRSARLTGGCACKRRIAPAAPVSRGTMPFSSREGR